MSDKSTTSRATRILGAGLALLSAVSAVGLSSGPGPGLFHSLGFLLTATFAWAAVFIPLWLAGAALLAFVPGWRPAAIVALLGSLFPFLPLAAIARLSTGSESFLSDRPYLYALGAPALMALCLALALALTTFVFYITRSVSRLTSRPDPAQPRRSLLIPRRGSEEDSSTFEEGAFDFRVPVLPALPFLGAIDEVQEVPSESLVLPDIAAQPEEIEHIEIVPQPEGEAEGRIASAPRQRCAEPRRLPLPRSRRGNRRRRPRPQARGARPRPRCSSWTGSTR